MEQLQSHNGIRAVNRDLLKYVALFLMGTGHMMMFIGLEYLPAVPNALFKFFLYAQMFAPPVFFFFISEGFIHARSVKKYATRLTLLGMVTQVPYYLCNFDGEPLHYVFTRWSVIATLLAGLLILMVWTSEWKMFYKITAIIGILAANFVTQSEWMIFGPVLIFMMYMLRQRPMARFISFAVIMLIHQFIVNGFYFALDIRCFGMYIAEMAAITVITFFYNGKKGHFPVFSKWVFYVFYPAHLLLAVIIRIVLS